MSHGPSVQAPPKKCPSCGILSLPLAARCKACGQVYWSKRATGLVVAPGPAFLPKIVTLVAAVVLAFGVWILMQPGDARHDPEPGVPSAIPMASPSAG